MTVGFSEHDSGRYRVTTPVYEGPLDLLLQLIERAELDITKLALAQVTDQYLEHLRNLPEHIAEEISSFLVIAARLLQIKSEVLLPRPLLREAGEEDQGEALARQLILYQKYRKVANFLDKRQERGLQTFIRLAGPARVQARFDPGELDWAEFLSAARQVYQQSWQDSSMAELSSVVSMPKVTIRQKIALISSLLNQYRKVTFGGMLGESRSRLDIVITFLALLELVKLHLVQIRQERIFGEIEVEPSEQWDPGQELELEFGE
jgi:segregation and condensation protein A